ncbi:hypothetical protein CDAR_252191 [Caerostris darwini]|uniref:RRM domain-containing protein n=1 Tax=Caerostris darwini TaxID=1538125 RepID=A0AAV4QD62_9ARAC|nr:hypothetical protein CDAR_252191 [Caerostris darwini]
MQPDVWNVMPPNTPKNTSAHGELVCVVMRARGCVRRRHGSCEIGFASFEEKAAEKAADKINGSETEVFRQNTGTDERNPLRPEKSEWKKKRTRCHISPKITHFAFLH